MIEAFMHSDRIYGTVDRFIRRRPADELDRRRTVACYVSWDCT